MLNLSVLLVATALAAPASLQLPADSTLSVRELPADAPARLGPVYVVNVEEAFSDWLFQPVYREQSFLGVPIETFDPLADVIDVTRGDSAGSPSFDPILRKYWWE